MGMSFGIATGEVLPRHRRTQKASIAWTVFLATAWILDFASVSFAASAQPRIRLHVPAASRDVGEVVLGILSNAKLGRVDLKVLKSPPATDSVYYKEGRRDLALKIGDLLGLQPVLSKEMEKTDIAIYLSKSYRLPQKGATPPGRQAGDKSTATESPSVARIVGSVLSWGHVSVEWGGRVSPLEFHSTKQADADAVSSVETAGMGTQLTFLAGGKYYRAGTGIGFHRLAAGESGFRSALILEAMGRASVELDFLNPFTQLSLGASFLGTTDSDVAAGPTAGFLIGAAKKDFPLLQTGLLATFGYRISSFSPDGFDWFVVHGPLVEVGALYSFR